MRSLLKMAAVSVVMCAASMSFAQAAEAPKDAPAATTQPAKITLNLEGASAEEAFDQIAKQAGVDLVVDNPSMWQQTDLVFLNVKDAAFWPTFMQLCQQSRVNFDMYYGSDRPRSLRLYGGGGENRFSKYPVAEAQGFMVFAQSAQRNYNVSYEANATPNSSFSIQLMVLTDPSIAITQMGSPVVTEAVDENGTSLMIPAGKRSNMYYGGGRNESLVQQTGLALEYPANGGKKIAKLKAYLRATAATRMEKIEAESPLTMKPIKKELPGYDVLIQPLKPQKDSGEQKRYELKITFIKKRAAEGTGGLRRENNDYWSLLNSIALTDANGRRYNNGGGGSSGGNDSYECTMNFYGQGSNQGEPVKLTWRLPAETKELRVPFEFKDLVIP